MSDIDELKRAAAVRAAEWIRDGMVLGLGTGSTVYHVLREIATQRSRGAWKSIVGVPTSEATAALAEKLGIPLTSLDERPDVDLTIDGADEVDGELRLIKGAGGALLREKIVANASEVVLIAVDESKRVKRLGTRSALPVEVEPFGSHSHDAFFASIGGEPRYRTDASGALARTDGGHFLVDLRFPQGIHDPEALELRINNRPGIIENGLFNSIADYVVTASPTGVEIESRGDAHP